MIIIRQLAFLLLSGIPLAGAFVVLTPRATAGTKGVFDSAASTATQLYSSNDVGVQVAQTIHPSVALVMPMGVRNMTTRGTGFVVDFDDDSDKFTYLITAAHVAAPGYDVGLSFQSESENRPATVVGRNRSLDLALLKIDKMAEAEGLSIAADLPPVGTTTFAHGYPASRLRGPAMTSGIVCGLADGLGLPDDVQGESHHGSNSNETTPLFVVTNAAIARGMSGGPLTDSSGTVLGVNALIRPDLRALGNYAVSSEEVLTFLEQVAKDSSSIPTSDKKEFQVCLFNDGMNKKERVSSVLEQIAKLKDEDANKAMMEAHTTGKGIIGTFPDRLAADELCQKLKEEDLLVEVQ